MSVVATTFGIGASTSRPATASAASAATSAIIRAVGRERSYQAKPADEDERRAARGSRACQLIGGPPVAPGRRRAKQLGAAAPA